jgi:hypothetical protein
MNVWSPTSFTTKLLKNRSGMSSTRYGTVDSSIIPDAYRTKAEIGTPVSNKLYCMFVSSYGNSLGIEYLGLPVIASILTLAPNTHRNQGIVSNMTLEPANTPAPIHNVSEGFAPRPAYNINSASGKAPITGRMRDPTT